MSSRPVGKAPVGRPPNRGASGTGSASMAKTASSSSSSSLMASMAAGAGRLSKGAASAAAAAAPATTTTSSLGPAPSNSSSNMQTYREIFVARSDGVGYTTQQINDASRSAQPVSDALDETTDFVRSWSVKLGKAIKYNLGAGATSAASSADPNNYLMRFPTGYALHVRPGKTKDRDGPLVFGHPLSPIAVFRSPAEFALHILWLLSTSTARADCSCRLCVRMVSEMALSAKAEAEALKPLPVTEPARAPHQTQAQPQPQPQAQPQPQPRPATHAPATPATPAPTTVQPPQPTTVAAAEPTAAAKPPLQPLPTGGSCDLFRPWELVWYQHFLQPSRGAWRLGIVLRIERTGDNDNNNGPPSMMPGPAGTICIAPIGFKGLAQLSIKASELRPFLSFSVPAMRQGFQGLTYDQFDWRQLVLEAQQQQQMQQPPLPGRYDVPTIALEASKAAANQINACFSVFNQLPKGPLQTTECRFGGVFLGAEMILLGDAVRVDAKYTDTDSDSSAAAAGGGVVPATDDTTTGRPHARSVAVMLVDDIITEQGQLRLVGDIYQLALAQPGWVLPLPKPAGPVFDEELAERNGAPVAAAGPANPYQVLTRPTWFWKLLALKASCVESEVHGRFYPSTRLAANLQNVDFLQRVQQDPLAGPYDDGCIAASALNRRQKVADFLYLGERQNRAATIGQAMSIPLPPIEGLKEGI